jgi:UDP-N-acetyl-D-mannosaminuronate dehydrogenase
VDPFYLTAKAETLGYHPQVILAGRRINDQMGSYIANRLIKMLIQLDRPVKGARVGILGLTFKENIPDIRTPLPGLYFASMSQVYPWDRGTNFAVEIGRRTARQMLQDGC